MRRVPRTLVILNPAARSSRAASLAREVQTVCEDATVRITTKPGEAHALAKRAAHEGYEVVVAAGGDGTVNEVVNGMADTGTTLGVLPLGTMNVFALELGIPTNDLARCWKIIREGRTREIDLPKANDHRFVQLGGVGLDAQTLTETTGEFKRNWGPLSYVINAAQIAGRETPRLFAETIHGQIDGSFVLVGNGRLYGGPFKLFNDAKLDDGKLDLIVFQNLGYLDIVRYLQAILFGQHPELPDVHYVQSPWVEVHSDQEVPVEVDGDVIGNLPVRFTLDPLALRVLVPPSDP